MPVLDADFDVKNASILTVMTGFKAILALRDDVLHVGGNLMGGFGGLQIWNAHGQQFLRAKTAHPAVGFIDLEQMPLCVRQPEAVHGRSQDGSVQFLALPQRLLRPLTLGDVPPREPQPTSQQQHPKYRPEQDGTCRQ